ncbi:MAG: general secretion pathway protein GspK [Spirochaetes bacterium]|jgi:type II secretory pathway component PulK|nr:general secretion pathway protein GspK [Spirochaetota bacterium]
MRPAQYIGARLDAASRNYRRREALLHERGILNSFTGSSGYVLVIVLLVISLLVAISSEFIITAQTNVRYIGRFSESLRARTIARAGINLAVALLEADKKGAASGLLSGVSTNSNIDSFQDIWAIDLPPLPIEGGHLKIVITDENSKINLNVLANEVVDRSPYYTVAQRFFLNMGLPMDLADALIDWVDIDDSRFPYGAESSDYYLAQARPYRAKNGAMDSIHEMLMVKGITPEFYYGLGGGNFGLERDLVEHNRGARTLDPDAINKAGSEKALSSRRTELAEAVVPVGRERSRRLDEYFRITGERTDYLSELNKININTASFRVLSALTDEMTDDRVAELIRRRRSKPFESIDEIADLITDETARRNLLTVRSFIFRLSVTGRVNKTEVTMIALYNRQNRIFYYMSEQ